VKGTTVVAWAILTRQWPDILACQTRMKPNVAAKGAGKSARDISRYCDDCHSLANQTAICRCQTLTAACSASLLIVVM